MQSEWPYSEGRLELTGKVSVLRGTKGMASVWRVSQPQNKHHRTVLHNNINSDAITITLPNSLLLLFK